MSFFIGDKKVDTSKFGIHEMVVMKKGNNFDHVKYVIKPSLDHNTYKYNDIVVRYVSHRRRDLNVFEKKILPIEKKSCIRGKNKQWQFGNNDRKNERNNFSQKQTMNSNNCMRNCVI